MSLKKLAKMYNIKRSILERSCVHVITTQDTLDLNVGADVGDMYISQLTPKEIETISQKENYIGVGSTGPSSTKFYYLRISRKYKIDSAIKKLKKIDVLLYQLELYTEDISAKQMEQINNISSVLSETTIELCDIWAEKNIRVEKV